MSNPNKPPIYISYAWGDSPDSEENSVVNSLCEILKQNGFAVIRDVDYLKYLDDLPSFLKTIGSGSGYVFAVVGNKYLHSDNCMIEASFMVQKGNLALRVIPILLSSLPNIFNSDSRKDLLKELKIFWQTKKDGIIDFLKEQNMQEGYIPLRIDAKNRDHIIESIGDFIDHMGKSTQLTSRQHIDENFKTILSELDKRITQDFNEFNYVGKGEEYYKRFPTEYVGRKENVKHVLDFLKDDNRHFLLLYSVGGMGKSHLIDECRRQFSNPALIHKECDINFNLKSLFQVCKMKYPGKISPVEEIQNYFIEEFCSMKTYLILDDFYETRDADIRSMLPKLASIPSGKILLVSRAIPKELNRIDIQFEKYSIPPLNENDFTTFVANFIRFEQKSVKLSVNDIHRIYEKAQGYPLGGQLIIKLLDLGESLDDILTDLPRFTAEIDEEGKQFSGRLLDNIFKKGEPKEIKLLCEFSALFGSSAKEVIRKLPSFDQSVFDSLLNRRRFIWKDDNGLFNSHAMIKDFAYEKLSNKNEIHSIIARYFESKLYENKILDPDYFEQAIQHFKQLGASEIRYFSSRVSKKFNIANVKSLIQNDISATIRNYKNLIELYPTKVAYYTELGKAYRLNNDNASAIKAFEEGLKYETDDPLLYNELGISYREEKNYPEAIKYFLKRLDLEPNEVHSLNELGIAYRESEDFPSAIETFKLGLKEEPDNYQLLNELAITNLKSSNFPEAINNFNKIIGIKPKDIRALFGLGIAYREDSQHLLAEKKLLELLNIKNQLDIRAWNELAKVYREINQIEKAINTVNKAFAMEHNNPDSAITELEIYIYFKPDYKESKDIIDRIRIEPDDHKRKSIINICRNHLEIVKIINDNSIIKHRLFLPYIKRAIELRACYSTLNLILKLIKGNPIDGNLFKILNKLLSSKILSKDKSISNKLKETIDYLNSKKESGQDNSLIFYYLNFLLHSANYKLFDIEFKYYQKEIENDLRYNLLSARYYKSTNRHRDLIISEYENAIINSKDPDDRMKTAREFISYLQEINDDSFSQKIYALRSLLK
ncbi:MAG: tetratricopeptide repeat protein [Bacteroidota bacterium]